MLTTTGSDSSSGFIVDPLLTNEDESEMYVRNTDITCELFLNVGKVRVSKRGGGIWISLQLMKHVVHSEQFQLFSSQYQLSPSLSHLPWLINDDKTTCKASDHNTQSYMVMHHYI